MLLRAPHSVAPIEPPVTPPVVALEAVSLLDPLLRDQQMYCIFQPIADLQTGSIFAHEALIRGPKDSTFHTPDRLFALAQREGRVLELELHCVQRALQQWGTLEEPGRLFLNISADALVYANEQLGAQTLLERIREHGVLPRMLVLEITEHERVTDVAALQRVAAQLQAAGIDLALDDFGDGRSSLRLWSELRPAYVKIDKYFTRDLRLHSDKVQMLQALRSIADIFGARLIAEGIETEDDLRALRDMQMPLGQGYLLGMPAADTASYVSAQAVDVLFDRRVAVLPHPQKVGATDALRNLEVIHGPVARMDTSNNEVAEWFLQNPELHAVAIVDNERPVALLNREQFMNHFAALYFRELHGRKPCVMFANRAPRLVELQYDVDELLGILTSQDQRYLKDGFIVTDNGRYVGLGTGEQLVRRVTEARIEAARHANPLTFLPGNIPITQHIDRLLQRGAEFAACYLDLNDFKPFNDLYGYWRGDEMIRLVARLCAEHSDPQLDFVGHVGGDDFIILFQSPDWRTRCDRIQSAFAQASVLLYDEAAKQMGGIEAEDRHGVIRFFPFTTLSAGMVPVAPGQFMSAEQVASAAASAKHDAKMHRSSTI